MVSLLGPLLLKKTVEEVEPQAEGNRIATSTNGLDICTLLHELACNNCDMHANECNKMFIVHYHNSVVSLLTQSTE